MNQNETKRHFELRNLDKDMQDAHLKASRVMSKRKAKAMSRGNAIIGLTVIVLLGVLAFLFGLF